jgi:hypothetical protein
VVGVECIFGRFPPSGRLCVSLQPDVPVPCKCEYIEGIMAPLIQIMPQLQELCGEPSPPMSIVHLHVDSLGAMMVASAPPSLEPILLSLLESFLTYSLVRRGLSLHISRRLLAS